MLAAAIVAALAFTQALPVPTTGARQVPALSFAEGLRRLIAHAPARFSRDIGEQLAERDGVKTYALGFTIGGLTACRVDSGTSIANVSCDAYRGSDSSLTQATFEDFKRRLCAFAGGRGRFFVESLSLTTEHATVANYWPSDTIDVTLTKHESKDTDSVIFEVALNPS